jgi:hypothetical protein
MAHNNSALRSIFIDPTTTDLYYGVDRLCRSHVRLSDPSDFLNEALTERDPRAVLGLTESVGIPSNHGL